MAFLFETALTWRGRWTMKQRTAIAIAKNLVATACMALTLPSALAQSTDKAPRKVVIAAGTQVLNSSYPYLMMPLALGYWKEEGLDVDVIPSGGSAQSIQQLLGKSADFAEVNSSSFIQAVATTGAPLRAVMANTTVDWSLVAPSAGPVKSVADFKGKTIGVSSLGTGGIPLLKAYLRANGLDPDKDVSIQPVGFGGMAVQALNSGRVDGLMYWASAIASFESAGVAMRTFRAPEWKTYADFSLITLDATAKDHPELVEAVMRGMAKASWFTVSNADCARRLFWKRFPDLRASAGSDEAAKVQFDLKQIDTGVKSMQEVRDLGGGKQWATAPLAGYERMQQFMVDNKVIDKPAPAGSLVPAAQATLQQRANNFDHERIRQAALACAGG
jgi:NitT/TauT family transport system substrate-binding protein